MSDKSETTKLSDALKLLDKAVVDTALFFEKLDYSNLPAVLKAFRVIKELNDKLKENAEIINSIYEKMSYEKVPEVLEANGLESAKSDGRNFIKSVRINASIPAEFKEAAHTWIRDVAKVPELIQPNVNPKSLSSFVKQYFEANAQWPPEEIITVHKKPYISIRKA